MKLYKLVHITLLHINIFNEMSNCKSLWNSENFPGHFENFRNLVWIKPHARVRSTLARSCFGYRPVRIHYKQEVQQIIFGDNTNGESTDRKPLLLFHKNSCICVKKCRWVTSLGPALPWPQPEVYKEHCILGTQWSRSCRVCSVFSTHHLTPPSYSIQQKWYVTYKAHA